ncbi:hypothetical protein CC1G_01505 [Coprinopsis cinerea okayama7|uniref:Hydrophobin n=1 Tax=Coprinopsis cinerea (strain Okayama-7 / 130 / ATCC MYA-4618 / FGSC 9003) TaxID=240176 RepID=A8NHU1_COPC7|nr:hypothetical protein CC1G_01505 [Coprinopsis cinerea okayama7\|eukprot:XP_001833828.1 hypothetical protein CC1G_01505 [Coprinopsis cinerea okayama7\
MFAKTLFALTSISAIFVSVAAIPSGAPTCATGPIQCCERVYESQTTETSLLTDLLGLNLDGLLGGIATGCSPLSVVGIGGGNKCAHRPVCCTDNKFNGLVNVGCVPVNVNL